MFVMMGVSFYAVRLLLAELGIADFGIYNIVGGVVAMFSSLRGLFASATQRFLNFEMGGGRNSNLNNIFNMSLNIHLILCLIVLIFAETIGLWFLNHKLNIDPGRLNAANWVFHCSVIATLITIMTIPFDAVIIAREKMKAFAYISIIDSVLKLAAAYVLAVSTGDKLKIYGFLILIIAIVIRGINSFYCRRNFEECKYRVYWNPDLFKKMGTFAGWNFLGNTSYVLTNEGTNILLNFFGGPTSNAARAIAYQVRAATMKIVTNIFTAVDPQIIKLYSQNEYQQLYNLLFFTSKISYLVLLAIVLPLYMSLEFIMNIWLTVVPVDTIIFVKLILVLILVRVFHGPLDTLFKATGDIKKYQISNVIINIFNLPISYVLLLSGYPLYIVFVVMIALDIVYWGMLVILTNKIEKFNMTEYFNKTIFPCSFVTILSLCIFYGINLLFDSSIFIEQQIYSTLLGFFSVIISIWIFGLSSNEKSKLRKIINNKISLKTSDGL
ncbi:oligosaccharide flippase family protein [Algoriphagus jejuensis]|uniref:Oligosaccharide flippase family protein n=2 Tax=Algoriphagus jejuensis TaxID=419934 RepID=A0ABP3YMQ7_9BACT